MAKYKFTALAADGATITGIEAAPSIAAVHAALSSRDLQPVEVREKKGVLQLEITKKKVPPRDLMHFSRQLAVFVKAGIPIIDGLEALASETTNKVFKPALDDIIESLRSGRQFAEAAARHPEAFPPYYLGILRSAELTGNLDVVLDELADYIDRDVDTRAKVKSALMYPAIIAVFAIVVVVVLTVFVLPRFQTFFNSFDAKLPLPTRMLLNFAHFMAGPGIFVFAGLVAGGVGLFFWLQSANGRRTRDRLLLRLPAIGDLMRHVIIERFCRILSSMLSAGVAVPEALAVSAEATNNLIFQDGILTAREAMLRGEGLARPLAASNLFPNAARQMFRVGEDTGTFDQQLSTAAGYLDRELEYKIKRFTALFEPMVILFVGIIVGFVAIALVSAMYGIYNQVHV
jgi:type IV pilus assembly protein PilC